MQERKYISPTISRDIDRIEPICAPESHWSSGTFMDEYVPPTITREPNRIGPICAPEAHWKSGKISCPS